MWIYWSSKCEGLYKLVQNASYATTLDSQVGTFGATCAACVDASLARSWSRRLMEPSWSFAIPQCHSVSWSRSAVGVMVIPQCFGSAVFWGCHDGRFKICCRIWLELGWWCSKLEKLEVILLHFAYLGLGRVKVSRFDFEKILVKMRYLSCPFFRPVQSEAWWKSPDTWSGGWLWRTNQGEDGRLPLPLYW